MRSVKIYLNIPADQMMLYYKGIAQVVHAVTLDGKTVQFPANVLRSVISPQGIHGHFEIIFDEDNRFQQIRRL